MKRLLWAPGTVLGLAMMTLLVQASAAAPAAWQPVMPAAMYQTTLLDVVISEVAWGGTAASSSDEWIELYNNTDAMVDLDGWVLASDDGSPTIHLVGVIPAHGHYLLERSNECTVSDIAADQPPYSGVLSNGGEALMLRDSVGNLVDSANVGSAGGWPGGSGSPGYYSMERIDTAAPDAPANWASNDGARRNGRDCDGNPLNATPRAPNSAAMQPSAGAVRIEALYYDTNSAGQVDEAVRLRNTSTETVDISGWRISDQESTAILPAGALLAPGEYIWCTNQAAAFAQQFGLQPAFETGDTDPAVPEMAGAWPRFADSGDECLLYSGQGALVDALVYKDGDTSVDGWDGPAILPWTPSPTFAAQGQILYRKRDQDTGLPVPDTDTAADWAQDPEDQIDGRRVCYPGWDLDAFYFTERVTETATLAVAVAPDNVYSTVNSILTGANESIQIATFTFRSLELADTLVDRLKAGVSVTVLLEGAPPFEGVTEQEKWIVKALHQQGAQVLFVVNDSANRVHDRYKNQHAKYIIVDNRLVLIGSENLSPTSMPADTKANGTAGRRGFYVITDAPGVAARVRAIFEADVDPDDHADIVGCGQMPSLCTPATGYIPEATPDWITYTVQFPTAPTWHGSYAFEVISSPENSLRSRDSLLGLLSTVGSGDRLLVQQLYEHLHWGPAGGAPDSDPNLRLSAYLDAARRGASVRILLDSYLDQQGDNAETARYLRAVAAAEDLDLKVRLANPASFGLHSKLVLAEVSGRGYVHVGSINGSEASSKVNRELALQVQSDEAYAYLESVFNYDWLSATPAVFVPLVATSHVPLQRAGHILISEVYYHSVSDQEWVELFNPTAEPIELSTHKLGDAVYFDDFEGMYRFPPGTLFQPNEFLVVATTAHGFRESFPHRTPDLEIFDSDPAVPNMLAYPDWGEGDWGLANAGDEAVLLDGNDQVVDAVVYGAGSLPGILAHPGVAYGHSLERVPVWHDSDDCSIDLRDWPYPTPGAGPAYGDGR